MIQSKSILKKNHRLRGDSSDQLWIDRFSQYLRNISGCQSEEDYCIARVIKASDFLVRRICKKTEG